MSRKKAAAPAPDPIPAKPCDLADRFIEAGLVPNAYVVDHTGSLQVPRDTELPAPEIEPVPVPTERIDRPLTDAEKVTAFRTATRSLTRWYDEQVTTGMTDEELGSALERVLGIWGGGCGPGSLDVSFQGSGLRIWAGWTIGGHHRKKPLFAGAATIAMAREVYGIANPQDRQMRLF